MVIIKFILLNREEMSLGYLDSKVSANHSEEINGMDTLEIITFSDLPIEKDFRLLYKGIYGYWKEFIIKGIEEERADEGIVVKTLYCESSFYETLGDYHEDKRSEGTANSALEVALQPTRWEVGQVDDLGISSINFYNISAKEAVHNVAETWGGEIRTRVLVAGNQVVKRYVDLYKQRGQFLGKRFTYTKDLESVTKSIQSEDIVTALYGYGKGEEIIDSKEGAAGGYGRRINFSEINNGKKYIGNNEAKEIWGRNNPDGSKVHIFGKVVFDDCEDKEELLQLTMEKLEELSKPLITYQAKVIDLKAFGFKHEGVELGDTVTVIDKEFTPKIRLTARVIKINRDLIDPEQNGITLGNFKSNIIDGWIEKEETLESVLSKQGVWDRSNIIGSDGTINTNYLDGDIDVLKTKLLSTESGWYTDDHGNIIFENADKTSAMMLTGEGFMIASTKLPNGEYNWRSFGTGDGFTAEEIVAGVLKGGKIKFDLENGTFLIGNDTEDYVLWFDGSSLRINLSGKSLEEKFEEIEDEIKDIELTPGPQGSPGEKGEDGKGITKITEYYGVSTKNNTHPSSWSTTPPKLTSTNKYLWNYEKIEYTTGNPTETSKKIIGVYGDKGEQGVDGKDGRDGIEGPPGQNGQSQYIHIRYSANSNGSNMTTSPSSNTKYIGIYNGTSSTAPASASNYIWSKYAGDDGKDGKDGIKGEQGIPGTPGADGKPTYTWVKYADTPTSGMSNYPEDKKYIGLAFNKTTDTESSNYSDYEWSLMPQNIEIGGRNLFIRANASEGYVHANTGIISLPDEGNLVSDFIDVENFKDMVYSIWVTIESDSASKRNSWTGIGLYDEDRKFIKRIVYIESSVENGTKEHYSYQISRGMDLTEDTKYIRIGSRFLSNDGKVKLEKGNTATDWSESPEDVEKEINSKVDQGDFDGLEGNVNDLESNLESKAEDSILQQLIQDYEERNSQIEFDKIAVESSIQDIISKTVAIETILGDKAQLWDFLESQITFSDKGIFISNKDKTVGVLISKDRMSFMDKGIEVASISGQIMRIDHGIFVESAIIGNYLTQDIKGTNMSATTYVGGD